jgi:hypothetical protein
LELGGESIDLSGELMIRILESIESIGFFGYLKFELFDSLVPAFQLKRKALMGLMDELMQLLYLMFLN